ncbi:MAG: dTMP kinase [Candidatus Micrarchaeia archaeon]
MIICFEGIDGVGKGTQIEMLSRKIRCEKKKYPDREGIYGELFNNILKGKAGFELSGESLFPMFLMDMLKDVQLFEKFKGDSERHLVVDRYAHSTLAYQCAQGFNYDNGKKIIEGFGLVKPDIVLVLDADPALCIGRLRGGREVFERTYFLSKVRSNYLQMYKEGFFSKKVHLINGAEEKEKVHESIMKALGRIVGGPIIKC